MMRSIAPFSLFMLFAMLACALFPDMASAAPDCTKYPGLTNHIAGCLRDTLDETADVFFDAIFPIFAQAIGAVLTLSLVIFGIMGAYGMLEKVGRDAFMLIMKVLCVFYFVTASDDLYKFVLLAMDSSAQAVVGFVPTTGKSDNTAGSDFSQITCLKNMKELQGVGRNIYIKTLDMNIYTDSVSGPWLAMDCMIDSVIGIRVANASGGAGGTKKPYNDKLKTDDKGVSRGLLYFFFGSLQTSAIGMLIAIIGAMFLWGMANLLIKALFIYIAGYIGVAVLIIFAPLFIPMVLFQSTKSYFDKWIKLIISFALQPVIILVFITFTIAAVDLATFSGKYSIMYAIAGDESQKTGFSLNEYLTRDRGNGQTIVGDKPLEYGRVKADSVKDIDLVDKTVNTMVKGLDNSVCTKALMATDPDIKEKCKQSYSLHIYRKGVDWDLMAKERKPAVVIPTGGATQVTAGEQILRELLASLFFAAIVVFVMNQLLMVVPEVANDLLGDFKQSGNLSSVGGVLPGQAKLKEAMSTMVNKPRGSS
jgi:hypothetical protein